MKDTPITYSYGRKLLPDQGDSLSFSMPGFLVLLDK